MHLSDFKNQVVLIEFWTVHCGHCITINKKYLSKLDSGYKSKGLNVIGIVVQDKLGDGELASVNCKDIPFFDTSSCFIRYVKKHMQKHDIKQSITLFDDGKIAREYKVKAYPTFILIDKNGIIVNIPIGYSDKFEKNVIKQLEK